MIGPAGCAEYLPEGVTCSEVPLNPLPWFLLRMQFIALHRAKQRNVDIVLAGSGLLAPIAWMAARWAPRSVDCRVRLGERGALEHFLPRSSLERPCPGRGGSLALLRAATWGDPLLLATHQVDINPDSGRAKRDLGVIYYGMSDGSPQSPLFAFALNTFDKAARTPTGDVQASTT